MKYLPSKDYLIYLLLSVLFSLSGACFTANVINFDFSLTAKILYLPLFYLNSLVVFHIIKNIFNNEKLAFLSAVIYIFLPNHLDVFLYHFQFQSLFSEFLILLALAFYINDKTWQALGLACLGQLLNTKLIFIGGIFWFSKKLNLSQKIYSTLVSLFILLFVSPLFYLEKIGFNQFNTLVNIVGNIMFPLNFSLLNMAIVNQDFFNSYMLSLILIIGIGSLLFFIRKNKTLVSTLILSALLISVAGTFVPFKSILRTEEYFYYYLPSFYPGVTLILVLLITWGLSYIKSSKLMMFVALGLCFYWQIGNFVNQHNFQDIMEEWSSSYELLPNDYTYERNIKLKYASLLIESRDFKKAKAIVNEAKNKYPETIWYKMLLKIADETNDRSEIEGLVKEMSSRQIPYDNEEYE